MTQVPNWEEENNIATLAEDLHSKIGLAWGDPEDVRNHIEAAIEQATERGAQQERKRIEGIIEKGISRIEEAVANGNFSYVTREVDDLKAALQENKEK